MPETAMQISVTVLTLFFSISLSISPALISALDGVARACYVYLNVH